MTAKAKIHLSFDISEEAVMTRGIQQALEDIRLTEDGQVIIPVEHRGYVIGNPAPCGTWERNHD